MIDIEGIEYDICGYPIREPPSINFIGVEESKIKEVIKLSQNGTYHGEFRRGLAVAIDMLGVKL